MSTVTLWLMITGIALIAFIVFVEITYRVRFGAFPKREGQSGLRQKVPKAQVLVTALMVLGFLIGVGAPNVAPTSLLSLWLVEPYAQVVYFAWCALGAVLFGVLLKLLEQRFRRKRQ